MVEPLEVQKQPKVPVVYDAVSQFMLPNKWSARIESGINGASRVWNVENRWTQRIWTMHLTAKYTAEVVIVVILDQRVSDSV